MRVAYCLYGQPRRFKEGYDNIMIFLKKTPDITFDFFYHTWFDRNLKNYECSPWRFIGGEELKVESNIIENLNELTNGIYMVNIVSNGTVIYNNKFVKVK